MIVFFSIKIKTLEHCKMAFSVLLIDQIRISPEIKKKTVIDEYSYHDPFQVFL